jgi:KRAB domain-containing zinc finger protein
VHEKSHTEENDCKCNECGKLLAHKSHLLTHKRIHTGERPYVCNECGQAYISKAHLTGHEKVHMKARSVEVRVENSLVAAPTSGTEDSSVE